MFSKARQRLSYANVTATMALFIALGGTSYAAVALSKNDVRSKHIKNGQVKKRDIAKNAINASKVEDGTLLSEDFKPGELVAGAPGPQGPVGPQGAKGDKGDPGTVDTSQFYNKSESDGRFLRGTITVVNREPVGADTFGSSQADCPAGYQAVGGGVDPNNVFADRVTNSSPVINDTGRMELLAEGQHAAATGWIGFVYNAGGAATLTVAAICSPIG